MLDDMMKNDDDSELRTGPVDEYRDRHVKKMTAVAMWTLLVIMLAFVVALSARVFIWIWP